MFNFVNPLNRYDIGVPKMAQMNLFAPAVSNSFSASDLMNDIIGNQQMLPSSAPGLEALLDACREVYPDQPNPLQVTAFIKYWYSIFGCSPSRSIKCECSW